MAKKDMCFIAGGYYPPTNDGPSIYIRHLAEKIRGMGNAVCVMCLKGEKDVKREEIINGIRIVRFFYLPEIPKAVRGLLTRFWNVFQFLTDTRKADVYVTIDPNFISFNGLFLLFRLFKKPYILMLVGDFIKETELIVPEFINKALLGVPSKVARKVDDYAIRNASNIICTPENIDILTSIGVKKNKIYSLTEIVPIDTNKFNPTIKPKLNMKNKVVFMFFGRLSPEKGIKYLIEAIPNIIKKSSHVHFVIIGKGGMEIGKEDTESYLKKQVLDIGIHKYVSFLGEVSHENLSQYIASADVVIFPGIWGAGAGSVTFETLAIGKPMIMAGFNTMVKEMFMDGKKGILVEPKNVTQIEDAVIKLAENPELRKEMGNNAYRYVHEVYLPHQKKEEEKIIKIFEKYLK